MVNLSFCTGNSYVGCIDSEREALIKLKQDLIDPSTSLASWVGDGDCCKWAGVVCSDLTGHVLQLSLRNPIDSIGSSTETDLISLTRFFSSYEAHDRLMLGGKINPSLVDLKHLIQLDLSGSNFQGIQIPKCLGSLKNLRYLNLTAARIAEKIPHQLGNLSNLQYLDLSDIKLHVDRFSWLSGLSLLEHLDLSQMNLSKASDLLPVTNSLPSFKVLKLSECELHQFAPLSSVNFSSLIALDLSGNYFDSSLFQFGSCFFGHHRLVFLKLSANEFHGQIPIGLGNLTSLRYLDLSHNYFNSAIPGWLSKLNDLEFLSLRSPLPPALGELSSMTNLDLFSNTLNGAIPMSLGQLSHLKHLDLSHNRLNGSISEIHFVNLTKLTSFSISENSLILQVNPNWVPPFQLDTLHLRSCHLGPHFPSWLHSQKHLSVLDISNTRISDTIPRWFWNSISQYESLNLSSNQIYGEIPNFDRPLPLVPSHGVLDLSNNALSGSIFHLIFKGENELHNNYGYPKLSKNYFSGDIPDCWMNWPNLVVLNLGNNFSGSLPISIGNLSSLQLLNLRNNRMVGIIPVSIQNCSNLNVLDMGENVFVGDIPTWMGERLSDVAHNSLSGIIPRCIYNFTAMAAANSSDQEFRIMPYHIAPLPNCPEKNAVVPEDRNENGNEDEDEVNWLLYASMALGFVLGFWCFMGLLLINRRWRYKYCYFLDGCVDRFRCSVRKCY
ncbi:lrrnt 2 domain-containing protein [Citrus sinensis]|nr:lrrnt 2 domain-containing protein [Citrus sinensis]